MSMTIARMPARHVPVEFLGRARRLRMQIDAAEAIAEPAIVRIWSLVRVSHTRGCPPPASVEKMWRKAVPLTGCLSRTVERDRRGRFVRLIEDRATALKFRYSDWSTDAWEPGIGCVRIVLTADKLDTTECVDFSLHAIARRFERGCGGDADVLADMRVMLEHREKLIAANEEFAVPVGDGRWVGNIARMPSKPGGRDLLAAVRSFLPGVETAR